MAIQILPVQQIGTALGNNTWTEELPHNADDADKSESSKCFSSPFIAPADCTASSLLDDVLALAYIHQSAQIPPNHSAEVMSPPPDDIV